MKSGYVKKNGLARVEDLTQGSVEVAVRELFSRVGFDREVVDMEHVITKLASSEHSVNVQSSFLGWLVTESAGTSIGLSDNTVDKYRRIARTLNIVPADLEATFTSRRLDFDSGRIVSEAA
jgi:hypothetical protein